MAATTDYMKEIYSSIGESDSNQTVSDYLTTGILPLNYILSGRYDGGIPVGRITEIYGKSSCGKTLMATMAMIQTQMKGGIAIFFDFEHAFDASRAITLGISTNKNKWIYKQPDVAEDAFEMAEKVIGLVRKSDTKIPITMVFDSIASMITRAEKDAKYDPNMKTRLSLATLMSTALKQLAAAASKHDITMIFLNQTRVNPGVIYGDPEYTAGGNSMKFYATLRVQLSKGKKIENDAKEVIGEMVTAKTVKNKINAPFKQAPYISDFDMGVDLVTTHINALEKQGAFGSTKGWLMIGKEKLRKKAFIETCRTDKKVYAKLLEMFKDEPVKKVTA